MKNFLLALMFAAVSWCASASAQTPPAQGPTFRTGVDVITIDVAAVDAQGKPVEGLLAPEFVVKVDGQQRRVVSVEQVRTDVGTARRTEVADPF